MPQVLTALLSALVLAILTTGCGKKGPLYLPDENPRATTTPAAPR
jgi:predicted small lipoprotein YifL